jgi:hypothetical protein
MKRDPSLRRPRPPARRRAPVATQIAVQILQAWLEGYSIRAGTHPRRWYLRARTSISVLTSEEQSIGTHAACNPMSAAPKRRRGD